MEGRAEKDNRLWAEIGNLTSRSQFISLTHFEWGALPPSLRSQRSHPHTMLIQLHSARFALDNTPIVCEQPCESKFEAKMKALCWCAHQKGPFCLLSGDISYKWEIDYKSLVCFSRYRTCSFNIFNVFLTFTQCFTSFRQSLFKAFY